MSREVGLRIAVIGAAITLFGVLVASGAMGWFGRLPGDIRIERPSLRVYVPITSMLLVSIALSVFALLFRRLR